MNENLDVTANENFNAIFQLQYSNILLNKKSRYVNMVIEREVIMYLYHVLAEGRHIT